VKISENVSNDEVDAMQGAMNGMFSVIQLIEEHKPLLLTPTDLMLSDLSDCSSSVTPVIVCISESQDHEPSEVCRTVISSIPDITVYNKTQIIYQSLPCPFELFTVNDVKVDLIYFIFAHSDFGVLPVIQGIDSQNAFKKPSTYWTRNITDDRQCFIYELLNG